MSVDVIKPGMYSVFQDLGRLGYQHYGVPVNGVMDERAHRLANILVGNEAEQATLEITLMGPVLRFQEEATIAVCGGDLSPALDGEPMHMNRPVHVAAGVTLTFGPRQSGLRAYLAVQGGFQLPEVMKSASTNVRAQYGGLAGVPLKKNDVIPLRRSGFGEAITVAIDLPADIAPALDAPIRVIEGREWAEFTDTAQRHFLEESYDITPQSDRMGYRLSGPELRRHETRDMLSETVTFGTIQVPPDGQPIILMADRGTSGGYPRIANVISVDFPRLAQTMPGCTVRFERISLDEAHALALRQAQIFSELQQAR